MIKRAVVTSMVLALSVPLACSSGFPERKSTLRFNVSITDPADLGSPAARRELITSDRKAETYTLQVEALKLDGTRDTSFNGFVKLSVKPGSLLPVTGPNTDGRTVRLTAGIAADVRAPIYNAFGETRIIAEDIGYVPALPSRSPAPKCADGVDNDGDGKIDYPADEGCAFANDDSEEGGTYAAGSSQIVYYKLPRISDLRGAVCVGTPPVCTGGANTPFKAQQIQIDTGVDEASQKQTFDVIVTRVASNGFYVQDVENDRVAQDDPCANPVKKREKRGYDGLFAFNFNSPPGMRVCDRLRSLSGTATEFFGSIQIGYPTWNLEEWNPKGDRACGVPEPFEFLAEDAGSISALLKNVHSLVRARTGVITRPALDATGNAICDAGKTKLITHTVEVRISKHFGAQNPPANPRLSVRTISPT
jgi:hypothetical protein